MESAALHAMKPRSYKDPRWDQLEAAAASRHGIPVELIRSIRVDGERSNNNQVSSAGARTVYQIIPETRASIIRKHGVDPYLSDVNAAEGAALLLKEALNRNDGNPIMAAREYHGGPDRSRWGPANAAYRDRVAQGLSRLASRGMPVREAPESPPEPTITALMDDYRSGRMSGDARSDFEADIRNGLLAIPARYQDEMLGPRPEPVTPDLLQAYQSGQMAPEARADFEADVRSGLLQVPAEATRYGLRPDGTPKGSGFLGELKRPDGGVMTEYSVGVNIDGKEMDIPTLVPTLTQDEVNHVLTMKDSDPMPESIVKKAVEHAKGRIAQGKGPFADDLGIGPAQSRQPGFADAFRSQDPGLAAMSQPTQNAPDQRMPVAGQPYLPNTYQNWRDMPELRETSVPGAKSFMGSVLTGDPKEAAQIMQANFPGVQVRESPEGLIATSSKDGAEYLIPNSFTSRDVLPTVAKTIPYAALGAAGPASATFGGAAIEATQEYLKQRAGGNPVDASKVLTTGIVSGAVPGLAPLAGVGYKTLAERVGPLLRGARPAATAVDDVARVANDAPTPSAPIEAPAPQPSAPSQTRNDVPLFPEEQMWAKPSAPPATAPVAEAAAPQPNRFAPLPDEVMGRQPVMATGEGLGGRAAPAGPKAPSPAQVSAEVPPVNYDDLAQLMRASSEGDTDAAVRLGQLMQDRDPRVVDAIRALGMNEDDLPLDWVLASRSAREIIQLAKSQSGSVLKEQEIAALSRVGARAQSLLEELGGTRDLSALDARVKSELLDTIDDLKTQESTVWGAIRAEVPDATEMVAPKTLEFLLGRVKGQSGAANLTPVEKRLFSAVAGRPHAMFDGAAMRSVTPTATTTYGRLDTIRQLIGETTGKFQAQNAFSNAPIGLRKKLYSLLVDDLGAAAELKGFADQVKSAKALTSSRKDMEIMATSLYGKLLQGSLLTKLESGVSSLSKGDVSKLVDVMKSIPEGMRENVMATALNAAFNRSFRKGEMSFGGFADWYDRLEANKHAMSVVMSNLPKGAPAQLKSLADLSRGIQRSTSLYSTTGKSTQMSLRDALARSDTLIHNLVGLAKRTSVGLLVEPVAASVGLPGSGLTAALVASLVKGKPNTLVELDQLLSTPEFRRLVKSIGTPEEKSAVKSLARHGIMARFFGSITGKKGTVADRERWIEESMTKKAPQ
jgi:hypothetical protein